jgi:tetratricopeptide (TPR) repeat protein
MEVAQAGLRIDPKHTGCLNCLALAWSYQGQWQRAVQIMDEALNLEPLSSRLHTNLGWIYARAHRPELALEHFCEGLRLEPESADSRAAFQQGVASAVQDWRVLVILRAVVGGGVLAYFLWGSVWVGVVLIPLLSLLVMLLSTTFVLQLFPLGRSLLPEEKQAECRWLNLGLPLVVLGSYLLLAFVPTMYGVGMSTAVAAIGGNMLALYSECRPGWKRWRFGLALLAFPIIVGLFGRFLPEDHRAGHDMVLITALMVLTYILNLLARVDQESEPYSALRGLVIREGLQRRAAQPEPK